MNAYVVKPVDFHEFVNAVKELGVFWAVINEPPPGSIAKRSLTLMNAPLRILLSKTTPTTRELIQDVLEADGIVCRVDRVRHACRVRQRARGSGDWT